jgi:hypothetical protein
MQLEWRLGTLCDGVRDFSDAVPDRPGAAESFSAQSKLKQLAAE